MDLHFKNDGTLDMRYSSSRMAASSGFGMGFSGYGGGASYSPVSYGASAVPGLHCKKDGSLDMRYNSSRVASSSVHSNHISQPPSSSVLHYKKDNTLDMRYSSSKAAASSFPSSYTNRAPSSSGLHYKKDGTLDMRYSSSKIAASSAQSNHTNRPPISSGLHYKKDGTLDMRYSSSKAAASSAQSSYTNRPPSSSGLHYKKDGSLDMRYSSSKNAMTNYKSGCAFSDHGIPENIPLTKAGIPDMRTAAAKEWVREQAQNGMEDIPSWIPRTKDGSLDVSKPITQEYLKWKDTPSTNYDPDQRLAYYYQKLENLFFRALVESAREADVEIPEYEILPETEEIQREFCSPTSRYFNRQDDDYDIPSQISESVQAIDYHDLNIDRDDKLGQGSFGVVYKATWNNQTVAVKELHLQKLTRREKRSFVKEITIMSTLGEHPNLVYLYGYTLEPLCLVMEYVELGSLNYLLHYCEDAEIEARITDGRIKKKLILGTVLGMIQLHAVNIVHGDLKPQNVLVSKDYTAKVTDFGLATLRGKTSSSIASSLMPEDGLAVCGTAGYMAPELLNSSKSPEYSSDIYSFGVMFNEVIQEEEPYTDQFLNFLGRGPFAAANYTRLGNRPRINSKTPNFLKSLIERCWHAEPQRRPSFEQIFKDLKPSHVKFPNSFEL
ncbi:unnamed protein product [Rotaria sp. Silwood1]|nr:unnamed protein product [Rotaria sp. Silwood1]CAF1308251.1 unnamed protein product [Rotaria sp. Silwood1]CAF1319146.1 unnamed protein product [Rotaria sp. Silwood1]CAF3466977.1 unnamed protein product [Rotaria sp. Silwood1]CAF3529012.1 unnamed protein product [Rotaria sp. Silwood1]